jgi:hypothetical protein
MGLSDRTVQKLRDEALDVGGKVYEEDDDLEEADVTHFDEDDDPLTNVGDVDEPGSGDEIARPVDWDIDANRPVGEVPDEVKEENG